MTHNINLTRAQNRLDSLIQTITRELRIMVTLNAQADSHAKKLWTCAWVGEIERTLDELNQIKNDLNKIQPEQ